MSVDWQTSARASVSIASGPATWPITVSFWVRFNSLSGFQGLTYIGISGVGFIELYTNGTTLHVYTPYTADSTTTTIAANTWYHVAFTLTSTTLTGYLNGASFGTNAVSGSAGTIDTLTLGAEDGNSAEVISQDVCFWNSALSAAEILELYRSRIPPKASLYAWYPQLGGGTYLKDFSGNARHMTVGTGTPIESTQNAPSPWGNPTPIQALRVSGGGATSITASGVTNVTGAAAVTSASALVASGTTQVTGAAAITKSAPIVAAGTTQVTGAATVTTGAAAVVAAGTTNVTGAAAVTSAASAAASGTTQVTGAAAITKSAAIVAAGTTQVTGAADVPSGLLTGYSTGSSFAGFSAWVYPRSNVAASDVVWCPLNNGAAPIGIFRISLNGTTLRFEATNDSVSSSYVFSQTLTLNAWTHVSLQVGSTTATSYVNGVAVDSAAFSRTNIDGYGQLIIGRNADATIRDAIVGSLSTAQVARAFASRAWQGYGGVFTYYPLLEGGQRLTNFGGFVGASTSPLTVLGAGLAEGSENPPAPWGGPNTLQYLTAAAVNIAITASGLTQVSGAAAVSSAAPIVAAGTTQVTGAAALTAAAPIIATGLTQVTGAAAVTAAAPLVAAGVTQVTGAAAVDPTWPIVATGITQVTGAAALSASAPITAAGLTQVTGASNLTTPGDVASTGLTQVTGTAALTAAAPLVAAGTTQTTGAADLASGAPLAAAGATTVTGVATVSSSASAASSGTTQVTGAADVSIAYSITAAGVTQVTGSAAFAGVAPPSSPGGDTLVSRRFLHTVGRRHVR